MNIEYWKVCEGCSVYYPPDNCSQMMFPKINGKKCPCSECLVKGICDNICDDALNYAELIYGARKKRMTVKTKK